VLFLWGKNTKKSLNWDEIASKITKKTPSIKKSCTFAFENECNLVARHTFWMNQAFDSQCFEKILLFEIK
jgi:hypothetical protein